MCYHYTSGPRACKGQRLPLSALRKQRSTSELYRHKLPPRIEPGTRPYQGRVLPLALQKHYIGNVRVELTASRPQTERSDQTELIPAVVSAGDDSRRTLGRIWRSQLAPEDAYRQRPGWQHWPTSTHRDNDPSPYTLVRSSGHNLHTDDTSERRSPPGDEHVEPWTAAGAAHD